MNAPHPFASPLEQNRYDRRWFIVIIAFAGMLLCLFLLLWPPAFLSGTGQSSTLVPVAPIYVILLVGYLILAGLTLLLLPSPWCHWLSRWRHNWVLRITTMLGFFLFVAVTLTQILNQMHGEHVEQHNGVYGLYSGYMLVRELSAQEYQQLQAEAERRMLENVGQGAAGAFLLGYAGIAGYGAWWLRVRPDWRHPIPLEEAIGSKL